LEILAVYPREPEIPCHAQMPPLGMLWIGGELMRAGHGVEFIDVQVDKRDPAAAAKDLRPALALVGGTSHSRFASFYIASRIKEVSPQTVVVYGGPHATFTANDTLQNIPAIDIIVRGEGEESCPELAAWVITGARPGDLRKVKGVSYRDDGGVVDNPPRPPVKDLDALGAPARELVPMERYRMWLDFINVPATSLISARGCPVGCTFCSASAMFGRTYRARDPTRVVDEVEALVTEFGLRGIKIIDSTFTQSRRHVRAFCAEMVRRGIDIPWECEIRIGTVDKPLLGEMRTAGCYCIDVGIESGSQRVLDDCIRKGFSLTEAEKTFAHARELGVLIKAFFTLGHPGETYEEAAETNDFIRKYRDYFRLAAYHAGVKIYPGTYVAEYARENGLLPKGFRWSVPYVNYANKSFFRDVDEVPTLIQGNLGIRQLRRLRLDFIRMKLSSPRFVFEKVRAIIRMRQSGKYLRILRRGLVGRRH
jgi:anaerobic magnesium-protoporphyrin IX monomethyl ester cyclase